MKINLEKALTITGGVCGAVFGYKIANGFNYGKRTIEDVFASIGGITIGYYLGHSAGVSLYCNIKDYLMCDNQKLRKEK